ncbi:MAG: hypothetical protein AAGI38_08625, partial [Bacteroidota bacterium]
EEKAPKEEQLPDEPMEDTSGAEGMVLNEEDAKCLQQPNMICEVGVTSTYIGGPMPGEEVKGMEFKSDTLFEAEGFEWRGRIYTAVDGGEVLVEGEYVDAGDPGGRLPTTPVNRIQVRSAAMKTADGVYVGQSYQKFRQQLQVADSSISAIYNPDYGVVDISVLDSYLHYNFPLQIEVEVTEEGLGFARLDPSSLPQDMTLESIVVLSSL